MIMAGPIAGRAAFDPAADGARSNGAGMTAVVREGDIFSESVNPALLGTSAFLRAGSTHTRLFGLKDLSRTGAGFCLPVRFGSLDLDGTVFGNPVYQETVLRIGIGFPLVPGFIYTGLGIASGQLRIRNFGSRSAYWFSGGLYMHISRSVSAGFAVFNPTNRRLDGCEPLPQVTRLGVGVRPGSGIVWFLELNKDVRFPLDIRNGIELTPLPFLTLRCGMTASPGRFTTGFGFAKGGLTFDYAMVRHNVLGMTHHATLGFSRPLKRHGSIPAAP